MMLTGLGFGAVGALSAAASATPILSLGLAGGEAGKAPSHAAGLAEWRALVGETFTLESPNGSHLVQVAAVTAFPRSGSRPATLARSEAFSVAFKSIAGPPLPSTDRLYKLVHPSSAPLPLYMNVPTRRDRKAQLIAVFN